MTTTVKPVLTLDRVTASTPTSVPTLSIAAVSGAITASTLSRTLAGPVVEYGKPGRTSAGKLRVRAGALKWPDDITRVKLTREHERDNSRGHLVNVVDDGKVLRVAARVSDGPEGDAALLEASDRTRDGFSFDVVDAVIEGDEIVSATVIAVGQVGIPAYDDSRIDTIAASTTTEGITAMLTAEEIAELSTLAAMQADQLDDTQRARLAELRGKLAGEPQASTPDPAPAPQQVAASIPAVPSGAGSTPSGPARTQARPDALASFTRTIVEALSPGGGGAQAITAALSDITHSGAGANIEAPAWSGELWSGVAYEPEFTGLLSSGDLTSFEGHGWRFVEKPAMADYAGDKAAIPSNQVTTEPATYEAARMAVGHDIDRKFYDFPNEAFLRAYVEAVRESWAVKLDGKVEAWIIANAVAHGGAATTSMFKAAQQAVRKVKRNKAGRATFVVVSDTDMDNLIDLTNDDVPAFLSLFNIDPGNFTSSASLAAGTVVAGAKQAATVRTLPGSPIRVSAQHIANGGIDEAFFGYWAIEQHKASGIVKQTFAAV